MTVTTRLLDYQHQDTALEAFFAGDDNRNEPRPGILIAHMWAGRVPFVCEKAEELAMLGYPSMALDMYGKGVIGQSVEENSALMAPFTDDRGLLQSRMQAALDLLKAQPEVDADNIIVLGYCFGGMCALDLARSGADIAGAISMHGLLGAPGNTEGKTIKAKILMLHGQDDPMAPPAHVQAIQSELTDAGCDWQMHVYSNTVHAFTNPDANDPSHGTVYSETADRRSWAATLDFIQEVVGY